MIKLEFFGVIRMDFKHGDIIEWCNEYYQVDTNNGDSGSVWELNHEHQRTGTLIQRFYWSYDGEDCKLIKAL
jgi:hypothetical protein